MLIHIITIDEVVNGDVKVAAAPSAYPSREKAKAAFDRAVAEKKKLYKDRLWTIEESESAFEMFLDGNRGGNHCAVRIYACGMEDPGKEVFPVPDEAENIDIVINEKDHPNAYRAKLEELVESGLTEDEARAFIAAAPFAMEVFYEKGCGLFAVEGEAVGLDFLVTPYNGLPMRTMPVTKPEDPTKD